MPETFPAQPFLDLDSSVPIIDVRSPSEFASGHIGGAVNVPLFDDEERAKIGTTYKKVGKETAVIDGFEIVGPKMAGFIRQIKSIFEQRESEKVESEGEADRRVRVHCWRGGMRSQSFAWLMQQASFEPIVLEGGYKAYRRNVLEFFERPLPLMVLSGLTGAGKTKYLHMLKDKDEQMVDLEGIANHRGSAFGGVGLGEQPSTESFENQLFDQLSQLDLGRRIWVEDEGNRVGAVRVPLPFYEQIRFAPAVFIDATVEQRLDHLLDVYGDLDLSGLAVSVEKIKKRLGGQQVKEALAALEEKDFRTAAAIVLKYYDKTYMKAVEAMPRELMSQFPAVGLSDPAIVKQILATANANDLHGVS